MKNEGELAIDYAPGTTFFIRYMYTQLPNCFTHYVVSQYVDNPALHGLRGGMS